jgi:ribosomal-protein-alanine N-acetyltransferase
MPLPIIETRRLRLRPFAAADLEELHRHWTRPLVRKYLWDDRVVTRGQAAEVVAASEESFRLHDFGFWCVRDRDAGALAGYCGFGFLEGTEEIEIGYGIEPDLWGRGLATEAGLACLRYGFAEKGFARALGVVDFGNASSARVLEKLGMTFERRAPHRGRDTLFYSLARADFTAAAASPYALTRI